MNDSINDLESLKKVVIEQRNVIWALEESFLNTHHVPQEKREECHRLLQKFYTHVQDSVEVENRLIEIIP